MTACWFWRVIGSLVILTNSAGAQERTQIAFPSKTPLGLVGNGASIVKVRPSGFDFFEGGSAVGQFRLIVDGEPYELQADDASSSFFPGGVSYRLTVRGVEVEVLEKASWFFLPQDSNDPAHGKRSVHCLRPRTARVFALKHRTSSSIAPYHSIAS